MKITFKTKEVSNAFSVSFIQNDEFKIEHLDVIDSTFHLKIRLNRKVMKRFKKALQQYKAKASSIWNVICKEKNGYFIMHIHFWKLGDGSFCFDATTGKYELVLSEECANELKYAVSTALRKRKNKE